MHFWWWWQSESLNSLKALHQEAPAKWCLTPYQQSRALLDFTISSVRQPGRDRTRRARQAWPLQSLLAWCTISQMMANLGTLLPERLPKIIPFILSHKPTCFLPLQHVPKWTACLANVALYLLFLKALPFPFAHFQMKPRSRNACRLFCFVFNKLRIWIPSIKCWIIDYLPKIIYASFNFLF